MPSLLTEGRARVAGDRQPGVGASFCRPCLDVAVLPPLCHKKKDKKAKTSWQASSLVHVSKYFCAGGLMKNREQVEFCHRSAANLLSAVIRYTTGGSNFTIGGGQVNSG